MPNPNNKFLLKLVTWLCLVVLSINPAFALQYMPTAISANSHLSAGYLSGSHVSGSLPKAMHISADQKELLVKQLKEQGYDVIPATRQEANAFLAANTPTTADRPDIPPCNPEIENCQNADYVKKLDDCSKSKEDEPRSGSGGYSHAEGIDLPNFSGGNDSAAVMLIVIGVVVIAAVFIYVGKYLVDLLSGGHDYCYWWDIGTHHITLGTDYDQHGSFTGIKLGFGFIANSATQFGLAVEIGKLDFDLVYSSKAVPLRLTTKSDYWLVGPTVRWTLGNFNKQGAINNSHFYFELLGGNASDPQIDIMAIGRVGFNTGISEHMRLGLHYGAFYLGLDEDQGIVNDGSNYWNMLGFEVGFQFD